MAHAEATARIATDATTLWDGIGSFRSVGDWHPMLDRVVAEGEEPGAVRTAYSPGGEQVERLLEVGPLRHRYTMESTPLPVSGYVAELRVVDDGDGSSTVSWSADFDATSDDALGMVQGFLEAGVAAIADRFGRSTLGR
jgi:hypothetical protein